MHLVGRVDEGLDDEDLHALEVPTNLNKVRSYFRQRGVAFSSKGRPVLPAGELVGCDLHWLSREALSLACGAMIDLELQDEGVISDELWVSLGCYSFKPGGSPADPVVPIVLGLDLRTWSLSLHGGGSPFVHVNHPELISALKRLLDEQNPEGWKGATRDELAPSGR